MKTEYYVMSDDDEFSHYVAGPLCSREAAMEWIRGTYGVDGVNLFKVVATLKYPENPAENT